MATTYTEEFRRDAVRIATTSGLSYGFNGRTQEVDTRLMQVTFGLTRI